MSHDKACSYCGSGRMVSGYLQGARLSFQPVAGSLADTTPGVGVTIQSSACMDCGAVHLQCDAKELRLASGA